MLQYNILYLVVKRYQHINILAELFSLQCQGWWRWSGDQQSASAVECDFPPEGQQLRHQQIERPKNDTFSLRSPKIINAPYGFESIETQISLQRLRQFKHRVNHAFDAFVFPANLERLRRSKSLQGSSVDHNGQPDVLGFCKTDCKL